MGKSIRKKRSLRKHKINPRKSMRKKSSRRSVRKSVRKSSRRSVRKRINYNQKKYNLIGGSDDEGGENVIPPPGGVTIRMIRMFRIFLMALLREPSAGKARWVPAR